jgi:heme exporter protein CcmD
MSQHAPFLWAAFGGALVLMLAEALAVLRRRRAALAQVQQGQDR